MVVVSPVVDLFTKNDGLTAKCMPRNQHTRPLPVLPAKFLFVQSCAWLGDRKRFLGGLHVIRKHECNECDTVVVSHFYRGQHHQRTVVAIAMVGFPKFCSCLLFNASLIWTRMKLRLENLMLQFCASGMGWLSWAIMSSYPGWIVWFN